MTEADMVAVWPLVESISPSAPWLIIAAFAVRGIHQWSKHLCELVPSIIAIADRISREGIRVRVEHETSKVSDEVKS